MTFQRYILAAFPAVCLLSATGLAQCEKLTTSDGGSEDLAGWSVALFHDMALIGARDADGSAPGSGAAYVFERVGTSWMEAAKLVSRSTPDSLQFGSAVAIHGGMALVADSLAEFDGGGLRGAVYVFIDTGADWVESQKLGITDGEPFDQFGYSVTVAGDLALIGVPGDDGNGSNSGSVYVYRLIDGKWLEHAKLTASDAATANAFGTSVSIRGSTLLVGAPGAHGATIGSGSAYIFQWTGSTWVETAELFAGNGSLGDQFGSSVDLSLGRALIGAPAAGTGGRAWVFERIGTTWAETAMLVPVQVADDDQFGHTVALEGDLAVVGAWGEDALAPDSGAVHVFEKNSTAWLETHVLTAEADEIHDRLGWSVDISDSRVIASAIHDDELANNAGAAYVMDLTGDPTCDIPPDSNAKLRAELVASGFDKPLFVCAPPNDLDRLFVLEQHTGRIEIVKSGQVLPVPFLDIGSLVSTGLEQGLLGLAFHPDYEQIGRFFVSYTEIGGDTRVVEYWVSGDPDVANPSPVQTLVAETQTAPKHNGGCIQFGSDGMLYVSLGDSFVETNAQDGHSNLGKLLRLDVNLPAPFIPPNNPFVGDPGTNDEIWARGLRNPWRFSFDRLTGDLWISDVGSTIEEINFQPATSQGGENYGWPCMEGSMCTGSTECSCDDTSLIPPIYDFNHNELNRAVIGGYSYGGSLMPWLRGQYIFGDWGSSNLWTARVENGSFVEIINRTVELEPQGPETIEMITSFGEDGAGELYVIDSIGGEVFKLVPDCGSAAYCQASPNSVGEGAHIASGGTTSISAGDMTLLVQGSIPGQFGIFFYGSAVIEVPFGDGMLCVGAGGTIIHRIYPADVADLSGNVSRQLDFTVPPASSGQGAITPGATWYFQYWYRDPSGPGGSGFNLTDGLSATFCP